MSTVASIVSLKVTPKRSSDHSFNIAGIIETRTAIASLGAATVAYSARATLYGHLADPQLDGAGNPTGRLIHDSETIRQKLLPVSAYVLSNEVIAADVDQAILRRQTQFLMRNQFVTQLHALVQTTYPAKVAKLQNLLTLAESHFQALNNAYNPGGGTPVGVTKPQIVMGTRIAGIGGSHSETVKIHDGDMGGVKQTHASTGKSVMIRPDGTEIQDNYTEDFM
jgi:hypothetical protein